MNETPLPTNGTHTDHLIAVCPHWPNSSEPATAEEAVKASNWGHQWQAISCRWRHTKAAYYTLPDATQTSAGPMIYRLNIGETRTSGANRHKKFLYCETHKAYAKKVYIREPTWFYQIKHLLSEWWTFTYVPIATPSGYNTVKLQAIRKNIIATMRKMW